MWRGTTPVHTFTLPGGMEADTLCFSPGPVKIQIRARLRDGNAVASDIISTTALEVLKDGEI